MDDFDRTIERQARVVERLDRAVRDLRREVALSPNPPSPLVWHGDYS